MYLKSHFGWATKEAQQKLREITLDNIKTYFAGNTNNKIV